MRAATPERRAASRTAPAAAPRPAAPSPSRPRRARPRASRLRAWRPPSAHRRGSPHADLPPRVLGCEHVLARAALAAVAREPRARAAGAVGAEPDEVLDVAAADERH